MFEIGKINFDKFDKNIKIYMIVKFFKIRDTISLP